MIRTLWCLKCGAARAVDTAVDWHGQLRCRGCRGNIFTACPDNAPRAKLALTFALEAPATTTVADRESRLYCCACGQSRTIDPLRLARAGRDQARLTCFRCGSTLFTASAKNAPYVPDGWFLTRHDREFLALLRIARGSMLEETAR